MNKKWHEEIVLSSGEWPLKHFLFLWLGLFGWINLILLSSVWSEAKDEGRRSIEKVRLSIKDWIND